MKPNDSLAVTCADNDVRRLTEADLTVLRLCLHDGLEPASAADLTGRSEAEVRALLTRVERWARHSIATREPGEPRDCSH